MTALSKVQASLVSGSNEVSLALAKLNFDFSLVKVEAPTEYRQLGVALAKKRRATAESGVEHITARRLGSLFQTILPDTPNLIRAYGLRASEIAQSPEVNPKGSKDDGPFQDYIGVDGTTLWAAATSSPAAIAAHLLACMLATHWPADKAIAIWVELVKERKKRLEDSASNSESFRLDDAVASQMSLDQEQLAMWDSSARAWLKAAEDAPVVKSRQKNLRSVLADVDITVGGQQDLYTSVTEAWRLAMSTFEAIIGGASYSISDGAVILALLSWHLYPDIVTLATKPQKIQQKDELVSSGQVIIGLASQDRSTLGVHWCLSLGHLSFYGAPQQITRSIALGDAMDNRLTLSDFTLVLLGGLAGLWSSEEHVDTRQALEVMSLAISLVKKGLEAQGDKLANAENNAFFVHFADAMSRYRTHSLVHDDPTTKLVNLGVRYKEFFRPRPIQMPPYEVSYKSQEVTIFRLFGMNDLYFGAAFAQQEDRLAYSRSTAAKLLIESAVDPSAKIPCLLLVFKHYDDKERQAFFYWGRVAEDFKTVTKENRVELKRFRLIGTTLSPPRPTLIWTHPPASIKDALSRFGVTHIDRNHALSAPPGWVFDCGLQSADEEFLLFKGRTALQKINPYLRVRQPYAFDMEPDHWRMPRHSIQDVFANLRSGELCPIRFTNLFCTTRFYHNYLTRLSPLFRTYQGLSGATMSPDILKCTGVFWNVLAAGDRALPLPLPPSPASPASPASPPPSPPSPPPTAGMPPPPPVVGNPPPSSPEPLIISVEAAKASPSRMLSKHPQDSLLFGFLDKDRLRQSFSLIATFEIGQDLRLETNFNFMTQVFAISVDDSLYIASPLLDDPASCIGGPPEIRRVRGNIGRPGLNFLGFFSPHDAIGLREKEPGMWKLINHHEFDGRLEDFFSATTLHLRLTGYVHEIALQGGLRFSSISFAEAVVSSHDSGNWVADLDLLNSTLIRRLILITAREGCSGCSEVGKVPGKPLLTIENWEELLDPPRIPAVFQAHGNWQARLAAVFICLKKGYLTLLFGSHGCWDCAFKHLSKADPDMVLPPIQFKSRSSPPGPGELAPFHPRTSTFEQGADEQGENRKMPSPESLKEDSSSSLDEPDFKSLDELSIEPSGRSEDIGDTQVNHPATAVNWDTTLNRETKDVDMLYEESSEDGDRGDSTVEREPSDGPYHSGKTGQGDAGSDERRRKEGEWPQDSGPRPVVFIL